MKLSVCVETLYTTCDLATRIESLRLHGIHEFELWDCGAYEAGALARVLEPGDVCLRLFCGNRHHSLTDPTQRTGFLSELGDNLRLAVQLKCPTLTLLSDAVDAHGIPLPSLTPLSRAEKLDSLQVGLVEAVALAKAAGVGLLLEPLNSTIDHPGYTLDDSTTAFEIVRAVGSQRLSVLFDAYHMQVMEGHVADTIEANLDVIGHVHVADVPGRHEPGTGEINFRQIARLLSMNGYSGYVGLECCPMVNDDEAVAAFIRAFLPTTDPIVTTNRRRIVNCLESSR
jgi:hydroxypyruvate isomerase